MTPIRPHKPNRIALYAPRDTVGRQRYRLRAHTAQQSQRGFTLTELIMVMVMLGILGAYAAPRMFNSADFKARGFHDETLGLLRFAQKTAIAQRRTVCVAVADTGVSLTIDSDTPADGVCNAGTTMALPYKPSGGTGLLAKVNGSTITSFQFLPSGATNQTKNVDITVTNSSGMTVEVATGFVHE